MNKGIITLKEWYVKKELRALSSMKNHSYCGYKNWLFPFSQHAELLFSICCIYAPCACFTSEVFSMPKSWRTGMILHLTTWLPIWIPGKWNSKGRFHPNEAPTGNACRMPTPAFQSSLSNAENGRQPSRGDKEPNVFHRYYPCREYASEYLKMSLTAQAVPHGPKKGPLLERSKTGFRVG